jgi:hypothetical protein
VPDRDPAAEAAWLAGLAVLAALLRAGLTEAQLSRLADLRVRARRGAYAADGYAGPAAPAPRHPPAAPGRTRRRAIRGRVGTPPPAAGVPLPRAPGGGRGTPGEDASAVDGVVGRLTGDGPVACRIRVRGTLAPAWADRLGGLVLTRVDGHRPGAAAVTELRGALRDQAALLGVLIALHDLGLPLLAVDTAPLPPSG